MERLTYWNEEYGCWSYHGPSGDAAARLAAYEDTGLEPEDIKKVFNADAVLKLAAQVLGTTPERLRELVQAEQDGRLAVLPCKVGDTVYAAETSPVIPLSVAYVGVYLDGADGGDWEALDNIGKTVFLTREEAEEREIVEHDTTG